MGKLILEERMLEAVKSLFRAPRELRVLARAAMRPSMSRAETSSDNAFMESCFGTLKRELEMTCYDHEAIARREMGTVVRYPNTRRRHPALGNQSPEAFEAAGLSPQPRGRKKTS